jgi:p-aminobenzoyl-glutamate transporter AbgT
MPRIAFHWRGIARCGLMLVAVALVLSLASTAWACPTCKEDLANDPQGRGLATGFYYSILLMMSMPFAIMGMLGTVAYRSIKRSQAERDAVNARLDSV